MICACVLCVVPLNFIWWLGIRRVRSLLSLIWKCFRFLFAVIYWILRSRDEDGDDNDNDDFDGNNDNGGGGDNASSIRFIDRNAFINIYASAKNRSARNKFYSISKFERIFDAIKILNWPISPQLLIHNPSDKKKYYLMKSHMFNSHKITFKFMKFGRNTVY